MNYKILKFGADWCMPCKVLNKKLEDFTDCEVVKYDVDDVDEELLEKFKIRNIPVTILLDENEEEIQRWIGVFDVNEISNKIREING
jgi:thioredoxin-like negative regulator of GroEL